MVFVFSQQKYWMELLKDFGMLGCKPVNTPLEPNLVVNCGDDQSSDNLIKDIAESQKLIGKLIYLTITRPYISFYIQFLS